VDVSNQLKAWKWFYLFPFIGRSLLLLLGDPLSSGGVKWAVGGAACCLLKWNFQSRLAPYFSRFAFLKCHFFPFRAFASQRQLPPTPRQPETSPGWLCGIPEPDGAGEDGWLAAIASHGIAIARTATHP